jgi:hypothetical protein
MPDTKSPFAAGSYCFGHGRRTVRRNVGKLHELEKHADQIRRYFYHGHSPDFLAQVYEVPVGMLRSFVNDTLGLEFDQDWGKTLPGVELPPRPR